MRGRVEPDHSDWKRSRKALELALKDALDLGMQKWAKAFQGEDAAQAGNASADCAGTKGPGRSEVRHGAERLRLWNILML